MKITTIIPAYNEAKNLPLVTRKVKDTYTKKSIDGEIILVNDGSTDNTREVTDRLEKEIPILKVIHHPTNQGLTQALMTCFRNASGDVLVFLPADMESDPEEDIPILLEGIKRGNDVVLGWRQNRKGIKRVASKVYNILSRLLFNIRAHDLNWIKAFKKEVVKDMELRSDWHRYIAILAKAKGYKIGEVKVNAHRRAHGKSKFGIMRIFIGLLDLFVVKFHLSFIKKPMLIFGSVGVLLFTLGLIGGIYVTITKFLIGTVSDRMPFIFLIVLLIILGIQFFALGFIAEVLATIREDIRKLK